MSNLDGEAVNPFRGNPYYNMLKEPPKFATAKVNGQGLEKRLPIPLILTF